MPCCATFPKILRWKTYRKNTDHACIVDLLSFWEQLYFERNREPRRQYFGKSFAAFATELFVGMLAVLQENYLRRGLYLKSKTDLFLPRGFGVLRAILLLDVLTGNVLATFTASLKWYITMDFGVSFAAMTSPGRALCSVQHIHSNSRAPSSQCWRHSCRR